MVLFVTVWELECRKRKGDNEKGGDNGLMDPKKR